MEASSSSYSHTHHKSPVIDIGEFLYIFRSVLREGVEAF